jgi:hypothetical protein
MLIVPFLLLGLICVLLIFLLQRASKRHLGHMQEQLYALEDRYRQLDEQLDAQTQSAAQQAEEAHRLMTHLEHELEEAQADKQLIELRASLTQLRQQFEEKSEILHQTRKQLFIVEGELLALQKEQSEQECAEENATLRHVQQCEEECTALEQDVLHLHDLVSALLAQKRKGARTRKKKSEEEFFSIGPLV